MPGVKIILMPEKRVPSSLDNYYMDTCNSSLLDVVISLDWVKTTK